jgi:perosamine synthetase
MKYPIYTPTIRPYTKSVYNAIQSEWISSQGEYIGKTSELLKNALGTKYVVLTNNGTSATHLLYLSLKFKYPNLTKIYVPNYVFVAVWNCALYEYSKDMIEVMEIDPNTLNMREDEFYILSLERNSAVVVVHNVGNVVNVPRLKKLRPDLIFVEDVCEAFMEQYNQKYTGTESLCAAVSFFGNKIITSGEGGAFYTNDRELHEFIYKTCHHGMSGQRYIYDIIGRNYRMTNIQAAFLYDQLLDINNILDNKKHIYDRYFKLLRNTGIQVATTGKWMFLVRVPGGKYDDMFKHMMSFEIDTRPMFYEITKHKHLESFAAPNMLDNYDEYIMLPSSPSLTLEDQIFIVGKIKQYAESV